MKFITFAVRVALVSAIIVISPVTTSAITVQEVPGSRPHSWVTDSIDVLSPKTEAEINRLVDQLEAKNSCEIMVVTVPETKGYSSPRAFALAWFNYWTIGKKGLDNGVLLMYSRGDDRQGQTPRDRIEIVTGWGIRPILPDAEVVSLIQRDIRPRVNQRDHNGAMLTGTQEVVKVLQNYQPKATSPRSSKSISLLKQIMQGLTTLFAFISNLALVLVPFFITWLAILISSKSGGGGGGGGYSGGGSTGGYSGGGYGGGSGGGGSSGGGGGGSGGGGGGG